MQPVGVECSLGSDDDESGHGRPGAPGVMAPDLAATADGVDDVSMLGVLSAVDEPLELTRLTTGNPWITEMT